MILKAMAVGIGLDDEDYFLRYHSGHENQLRLLHYPPVPAAAIEEGSMTRMDAHSDWGSITMLFQDDCGGLQVPFSSYPMKTAVANTSRLGIRTSLASLWMLSP